MLGKKLVFNFEYDGIKDELEMSSLYSFGQDMFFYCRDSCRFLFMG